MMHHTSAEIPLDSPSQTIQKIQTKLVSAVQIMLDTKVRERGYENIQSACAYALSRNPEFAAEGKAFIGWCEAVWSKSYEIFGEILSGRMPMPAEEEFITMLPKLTGVKRKWVATD